MPATTPVLAFTVPTPVLLLLHVPPDVLLLNAVVLPTHTLAVPPIAPGIAYTVATAVAKQPVDNVYVIVVVPGSIEVTMPLEGLTIAIDILLLVHVPPEVELDNVVLPGLHRIKLPVIAPGVGLIVTAIAASVPQQLPEFERK